MNNISAIFLCILITSCQVKKEEKNLKTEYITIDLENGIYTNEPLKLSEIASSVKYIALETNSNSLIRNEAKFEISKKYFLIGQGGGVMQFDMNGNFIRKVIKIGRGPDEGFIRCSSVDSEREILYFYDNFRHDLIKIDLETGVRVEKIIDPAKNLPTKDFTTGEILYFRDNLVSIALNSSKRYFFIVTSLIDYHSILRWDNKYDTKIVSYNSIADYSSTYFQNYSDTVLFKEMFNDTIFQTIDFQNYSPKFVLTGGDKSSYKLYQSYLTNSDDSRIDNKLIIGRFFESSRHLIFFSYYQNMAHINVFDKDNKTLKIYNGREIINDLDNGVNFKINWNSEFNLYKDEQLFCLIDALKIVENNSENDSILTKPEYLDLGIDSSSNPIIMIVNLTE